MRIARLLATLLGALVAAVLLAVLPVSAHQPTFSTLDVTLGPDETSVAAQLSVLALLHESDGGGSPLPPGTTAADLAADPLDPAVAAALAALLAERVALAADGEALPLDVGAVAGGPEEVTLAATAPTAGTGDLVGMVDLFPSDSMHKAFLTVRRGEALAGQWALDAGQPDFALDAPERSLAVTVVEFVREGVRHIFIGPDHVLFVLALILLGGSLRAQVRIVTAFTLAHSVTLTLATLGFVTLPSRLIESAIALSVVMVGFHDLWQLMQDGPERLGGRAAPPRDLRPTFALAFGLVHGFGFASVLGELGLPREALAWALGAFNIGVELGQVAIVLAAAPALWALRRFAPPIVARGTLAALAGSVVLLGALWFWQRAVMGA